MTRATAPWQITAGLIVAAIGLPCSSGKASEPTREFLQGLRARGYYDVAIDYLDDLAAKGRGPRELLETVDLEKAITLLAGARTESDAEARERQLDHAQQLLRQFLGQHPQHAQANAARTQLGNLIAERARLRVQQAGRGGGESRLAEARQLYAEARQVFSDHQVAVRAELDGIPKVLDRQDVDQAKLAERRTQLRADELQAELLATVILEESADTLPDDSNERTKVLEEAARKYDEIYKQYRTRLAGLYARLYRGRVSQKLGNYRDALGHYVELLDQPDSEPFRTLKTATLRLAVDCWLNDSENKYVEVIRRCGEWLTRIEPHEERDPDWLYLRLALARAYVRQASEAAANRRNSRAAVAARNEAEKQAEIVARHDSPFRSEARRIIADLGGAVPVERDPEVRDFTQARSAAKKLLDSLGPAQERVTELSQLVATADVQAKPALEHELGSARQAVATIQKQSLDAFRFALRLADRNTPSADVNLVRYMLTYVYFTRGDYYEAALLGDFVAQRYPEGNTARRCGELALASYLQLYNESQGDDKQFEAAQVIAAGQRILEKWSAYPEGEQAAVTLIPFMINTRQLDRAAQYLAYIPDQSPRKSEAAMKTGIALWRAYLEGAGADAVAAEGAEPPTARSDELKSRAQETLAAGVDRLPADAEIDKTAATAVLCLAQSYLATGQPSEAIKRLLDPAKGPLSLVRKGDPASSGAGFVSDTYRTALRAYIGTLSSPGDSRAVIEQTRKIMAEMAETFGSTPQGQRQLVAIYMASARELESQLKVADPAVKAAVSGGFETFLTQLGAGAKDPSVLHWVAETFASLAAGYDTAGDLNPTAAEYLEQAARTFGNLLEQADVDAAMRPRIQLRLAEIRRKQRKYDEAMKIYQGLLSETNRALNLQIAAAETLQQWAGSDPPDRRVELYRRAIQGDERGPDGKIVVWGWGQIANVTAKSPQYRDNFHAARLNLTRCRIGLAETKQGAERLQLLKVAEKDVSLTKRLFGLGDDVRQAEYDAVMRQIQQLKGEPQAGLRALDPPAAVRG